MNTNPVVKKAKKTTILNGTDGKLDKNQMKVWQFLSVVSDSLETKELLQKSSADSGPNRKEQKRFQKTRKPNITGHKRKQSGDFQGKQDRQGKQGKQGWQGKGKQGGNQNGRTNRKDGPPQKKRRMSSSRK